MPLSAPQPSRRRIHTREVRYEGFRRDDGAYEVDARLTDVKDADYTLITGLRRTGEPVHQLSVRIAFDRHYIITAVEASSDWVPYPGACGEIAPAYKKLIGLSLMHGFRNALRDRLGGSEGCTHITEMLGGLPTAAVQMRAGEVHEVDIGGGGKPFQLDRCHALVTTGPTVRRYYAQWYRDGMATAAEPVVTSK